MAKEVKTNAMRQLDRLDIPYEHHEYVCKEFTDGGQIADELSLPHEIVYKTLVTQGNSKGYFVFVLPIDAELDMKKSSEICWRKVGKHASCKGHQCCNRLCAWRMYVPGNEKKFCYKNLGAGKRTERDICKRRTHWFADITCAGRSKESGKGGICRHHGRSRYLIW